MSVGRAHEQTLPLLSFLREMDGTKAEDAYPRVRWYLQDHRLADHIAAVIAFADGERKVILEPSSAFGSQILDQLVSCAEIVPCADDQHEFDGKGTCRWCGSVLKT